MEEYEEMLDQVTQEEDNNEIEQEFEDSEQEQSATITKEQVEKYGLPPNFVGKPVEDMFKSYQEMRKLETKNAQKLSSLETEINRVKEDLTKKEVKQVEKIVEDKLPDVDSFFDDSGFLLDKKGYNAYLTKREELLLKQFEAKLNEKAVETAKNNETTLNTVQQLELERQQVKLHDYVVEGLSEIYDEVTQEVLDESIQMYNDYLASKSEGVIAKYHQLYAGNPEILAEDILKHYKANKKSPKEDVEKVHKKEVEKLKLNDKKFTRTASAQRQHAAPEDDEISSLIARLEAEAAQ